VTEHSKENAFVEAGAIFSFMEAIACSVCAGINVSVRNCALTGFHGENFHYVTIMETVNKLSLYIPRLLLFFSSDQQCLRCWRILSEVKNIVNNHTVL